MDISIEKNRKKIEEYNQSVDNMNFVRKIVNSKRYLIEEISHNKSKPLCSVVNFRRNKKRRSRLQFIFCRR